MNFALGVTVGMTVSLLALLRWWQTERARWQAARAELAALRAQCSPLDRVCPCCGWSPKS